MLTKSRVLETIQELPDQVTFTEIMDYLQSLADLEAGLEAIRAGNTFRHEDVMADARQFIKDKQCQLP